MSARSFLIRGLLAGLFAGLVAFAVAHQIGEPSVNTAIALEEAGAAAPATSSTSQGETHSHDEGTAAHSHDEEGGTEVSRANQSTWGLLTGTLGIGLALGGIVALVSAGVVGRMGRLTPGASTAVVALVGFIAFALVPFLKYPATPPAVGSGETIGSRTGLYFAFLLISLVAAVLAVVLALRVADRLSPYAGVMTGVVAYLVVVVAAGQLLPTVNEIGDFPGDTLWFFRRASLLTLASMWAVIGVVLTGLIGRLHTQTSEVAERRALAASL